MTPNEAKLMLLLFLSMILLSGFISCSDAKAYVPHTSFVFDKITSQHGRGGYLIDMEVSFHEGLDSATIKEHWLVADGGEMRMQTSGENGHICRLLKHKRIFWSSQGSETADNEPDDYFMAALLTRGATEEKRIFLNWQILPPEAMVTKKLSVKIKNLKEKDLEALIPKTDPWVRLGRTSGAIALAYGTPSPVSGPLLPGLWVEQDAFTIRKIRTPDGAEFLGDDYAPYSKSLWFPRKQTINFDNHSVSIRVLNVRAVTLSSQQKRQLDPSWIRTRPEAETVWPQGTLGAVIRTFYTRFR